MKVTTNLTMAWKGVSDDSGSDAGSSTGVTVGYLAAVIGCVAFGSFAVPIKSQASLQRPVDPLGALFVAWKP